MKTHTMVAVMTALIAGTAVAQDETNLGGTRLCLSAKYTVTVDVDGAGRMNLKSLGDRLYAEVKRQFKAAGVAHAESENCGQSSAAFYITVGATSANRDGWRAYNIGVDVSDWANAKYRTYVEIWSGGLYGTVKGTDDSIPNDLFADAASALEEFVEEWKASN